MILYTLIFKYKLLYKLLYIMSYEPKKIVYGFNILQNVNYNKYDNICISPSSLLTIALHYSDYPDICISEPSSMDTINSINSLNTFYNPDDNIFKSAPICIPKKTKK